MEYLKIKNWDRWQTFRKDRATPPWIKLYRNLLTNPEWVQLSDAEKGQLVSIWLIAADKGGKIPADPNYLRKMCLLDTTPNIKRFKDLGFLVSYSRQGGIKLATRSGNQKVDSPTTTNANLDQAETETETETETEKTPLSGKPDPQVILDYLNLKAKRQFKLTPKHSKAIKARIKEGYSLDEFREVVDNMVIKWGSNGEMMEFLRPITVFGTKMDGYLNMPMNKNGARNWDAVEVDEDDN